MKDLRVISMFVLIILYPYPISLIPCLLHVAFVGFVSPEPVAPFRPRSEEIGDIHATVVTFVRFPAELTCIFYENSRAMVGGSHILLGGFKHQFYFP